MAGIQLQSGCTMAVAVVLLLQVLVMDEVLGQGPPQAQVCPEQNEIAPCICTVKKNGLDILCETTDLTHITKSMGTLKGKSPIIFYLKLRHNNLPKLQGFVFLALDIRHLTIHNSSLAAIEENALSSLGAGLTQLDVSLNQMKTVPSQALQHLFHLLILNLNHNKITVIHNNAFEGLETLEILTLYENKITQIDPEAFRGLEDHIKRLNLGGNDLTNIPQKALSILSTLKKLEIQENKIRTISEGDFEGLQSLDSLILAHNMITTVPANVFSHLSLLNSLELEGNKISAIDKDAFKGLEENLQYLRLGDNQIHTIPSEALRPLHRLRHLDLRNNNINVLAEDAFTGFGDSLTFLNLQKNDIKVLPSLLFENLNSLETLNLQNNKLQRIPQDIMEPVIDTLRIIDITDNPLNCSCELTWFPKLLEDLKNKDDEMSQKKKPLCHMSLDNREYFVQAMPTEKMHCAGLNVSPSPTSGGLMRILQVNILAQIAVCSVAFLTSV
ncbi:leucine-rich repeats and immunoglobulin-like domains protein 2 isoform X1 [Drosophila sechellia]|uniref:leucine-rich repeats and immunoglobulin-like domains protein 2 isoform X1 n=1 Tax=Drosophila sechellia TaxID=7238 RepID=UPI0013DDF155|nr:leucine-rich repeats and immunoglobulin-like domains protein 2 isoform X1 [Drosophila sechellia]XP_032570838.1 leucine-rich repeats and immunoglobulin-like domains protein 2 isoform X1 [Drosophila sechellia]